MKTISPFGISADGGRRRMIDSAVTDLPDPDSPTSATVSPRSISKLAPSTAVGHVAALAETDARDCGPSEEGGPAIT